MSNEGASDPIAWLAGLIGLPFFGVAFLWYFFLLARAKKQGLISFSNAGLYYGMYDIEFAWDDMGPAWSYTVMGNTDVLFVLRNASEYQKQLSGFARWHFGLMERQFRSKSGGALDQGVKAFGMLFGELGAGSDAVRALENARLRLQAEPGSAVLGLPSITRFGLSNDETIEIINTVVAEREAS